MALYDEGFRKQVERQARDGQKGALDTLRAARERINAGKARHSYPEMVAEVNRILDEIEAASNVGARETVSV